MAIRPMEIDFTKYDRFVEHPRYGRAPIITGLNPSPFDDDVNIHWNAISRSEIFMLHEKATGKPYPYMDFLPNCSANERIPFTAIVAECAKQTQTTVPVTHYFDLERVCRDCQRPFIFFAVEQKHWYEELGFNLSADAVHCVECRKKKQQIAQLKKRYETLHAVELKSSEELLELSACCTQLVEMGVFTPKKLEFARMLLNRIQREQ